jgi:hypothetical protein
MVPAQLSGKRGKKKERKKKPGQMHTTKKKTA